MTIYNADATVQYLKFLILLLPFILLIGTSTLRENILDGVYLLSISLLISSVVGYVMMNQGTYLYTRGYVYLTASSNEIRFAGLVGDAVVYGQLLAVVISCNSVILLLGQGQRGQLTLSILLGFFALLTYSKASILCVLVVIGISLIAFLIKSIKRGLLVRDLCLIAVMLIVVIIGVQYVANGSTIFSIDAMNARLDSSDLLTGRTTAWQGYLSLLDSEGFAALFRGVGFAFYNTFSPDGNVIRTHNLYLESVVIFGWIVTIALIAIAVMYLWKTRKNNPLIVYLPLATMLITGCIVHGFLEFSFFSEWLLIFGILDVGLSSNAISKKAKCGRRSL